MADADITHAPAPDATVEPQKCGNCRFWCRQGYTYAGRCEYPLPTWVYEPGNMICGSDAGSTCDAWQRRGAE